jgi:hypothetical protein
LIFALVIAWIRPNHFFRTQLFNHGDIASGGGATANPFGLSTVIFVNHEDRTF